MIKQIFKLSLPVMIGMVLQSLLATVDMYFVSALGTTNAAAVSIGASAYGVVLVFSALIYSGTIAISARRHGEGDTLGVKRCAGDSVILSLVLGSVIGLLAYIFTEDILKLMFHPDAETLDLTTRYMRIILISTGPLFASTALRNALQGVGDTLTPLIIFGAANVINGVLDPLLIFGFHMGIVGAAWATVISNLLSFILITILAVKKMFTGFGEFWTLLKPSYSRYVSILEIGIWAALQQLARPVTGMLMFGMVFATGGQAGTAAFGIGGQLFNYTFVFLIGISVSIAIITGQSLGRGDYSQLKSTVHAGLKVSGANMLLFIVPYVMIPEFMIGLFITDPLVIKIGAEYLRIIYFGLWTVAFTTTFAGAFQGAGDTFPPMVASLIANVIVKVPLAYVLAFSMDMGTTGVWIAVSLSVVVEAVLLSWYYYKKDWKAEALGEEV